MSKISVPCLLTQLDIDWAYKVRVGHDAFTGGACCGKWRRVVVYHATRRCTAALITRPARRLHGSLCRLSSTLLSVHKRVKEMARKVGERHGQWGYRCNEENSCWPTFCSLFHRVHK